MVQIATSNRFGAYFMLYKQPQARILASLKRFAKGTKKSCTARYCAARHYKSVPDTSGPPSWTSARPPTSRPVHDTLGFA